MTAPAPGDSEPRPGDVCGLQDWAGPGLPWPLGMHPLDVLVYKPVAGP